MTSLPKSPQRRDALTREYLADKFEALAPAAQSLIDYTIALEERLAKATGEDVPRQWWKMIMGNTRPSRRATPRG